MTTEFIYDNPTYPSYPTAIKDPRGITGIRNDYDDDGRLKSHTDADGKTITYIHNINGRKETIVDRLGHTNIFSYDAKGNVTMSVNPLGETNLFTYDDNGNKLSETNPKGETIAYTYDGNNNLLLFVDIWPRRTLLFYAAYGSDSGFSRVQNEAATTGSAVGEDSLSDTLRPAY